jgi:methylated-DNA-[protein]-cysteine S-methyltransferase
MIEAKRTFLFETTLGTCRMGWSDRGITGVALLDRAAARKANSSRPDGPASRAAMPPDWVRDAADLVARHLAGEPQDLSGITLDTGGLPPFHRAVYEAARRIGPGCTVSYGELAARAGSPRAARAVGRALARNPFLLVVPCHRVLASGGRPGGFSAPGGLDTKARMLALEEDRERGSSTRVEEDRERGSSTRVEEDRERGSSTRVEEDRAMPHANHPAEAARGAGPT